MCLKIKNINKIFDTRLRVSSPHATTAKNKKNLMRNDIRGN